MQDGDDAQELLTVTEAAQLLHVSHNGLCNMLASGKVQGVKVGQAWRIARSEVARKLADDPPKGYFVRQTAETVTLAGGRVFRMPTEAE